MHLACAAAASVDLFLTNDMKLARLDILGIQFAEADHLCRAQRHARATERADTRAWHDARTLTTKVGQVRLQVPKLRTLPFETAIIERYKRREASVEEAPHELYLAGRSVRRVEDSTEVLWGTRVNSGLPRTRGDRPSTPAAWWTPSGAAPHTRG